MFKAGMFFGNNKFFSGYKRCQVFEREKDQGFENHLYPRPQGTEVGRSNELNGVGNNFVFTPRNTGVGLWALH